MKLMSRKFKELRIFARIAILGHIEYEGVRNFIQDGENQF